MSDYLIPAGAVLFPTIGGVLGTLFCLPKRETEVSRQNWFKTLKKPSYNPPSWLVPPVWTGLYCSMGYASYMVWRDGNGFDGKAALPLACYGTQLALNWAWSPIFFKGHKLGLATITIGAMWGAIVATMVTFHPVNSTASYMLIPYLGWVSFASLISFKIWRMNKDRMD